MNKFYKFLSKFIYFPAAGEIWILRGQVNKDPFPKKKVTGLVRVLDVKNNWVRFELCRVEDGLYYSSDLYPDERLDMFTFLFCYSFYKKEIED